MALRVGQILCGTNGSYELVHSLKGSTVFQAKILAGPRPAAKWAVVKSAETAGEAMRLRREQRNYRRGNIASSPHVRALLDTVPVYEFHTGQPRDSGTPHLVFEWMDHALRAITAPQFRRNPALPRAVAHGVLSALAALRTLDAVHTAINPDNIFVSNPDGSQPVAKLGGLSSMANDSSTPQRTQCLPCRAPEVWQGYPCQHAADIWSLGVSLTTAASPHRLFGHDDKIVQGHTEAWCIAKMIRLVGPLGPPVNPLYKEEFERAKDLANMYRLGGRTRMIDRRDWRTELESVADPPVPSDLLDFIASLLVMDPDKRPVAEDALLHPYLKNSIQR